MKLSINVSEIIGFTMRTGMLDRYYGGLGGKNKADITSPKAINALINSAEKGVIYNSCVPICLNITYGNVDYELTAAIDGVIDCGDFAIIEESYVTRRDITSLGFSDYPEYDVYLDFLGYMYAEEKGISSLSCRLCFVDLANGEVERVTKNRTKSELYSKVINILEAFSPFARAYVASTQNFKSSAYNLKFPYREYRLGQQQIILSSYGAVKKSNRLTIEAPTGLGKTLSVCYGAVKAVGDGYGEKIFYFTPKSTVGQAPMHAVETLRAHGLTSRVIIITAKEKCCLCKAAEGDCRGDKCPFAKTHYDFVNKALLELFKYDIITVKEASEIARLYGVCPYELMLDASIFCNIIICDCSYLFDSRVYLRRYFSTKNSSNSKKYIALIDEAHDLVARAGEMYSEHLSSKDVIKLSQFINKDDSLLYLPLKNLLDDMFKIRNFCTDNIYYDGENECGTCLQSKAFDVIESSREFYLAARKWLKVNGDNASEIITKWGRLDLLVKELSYKVRAFADASEREGAKQIFFAERRGQTVNLKVICPDPSKLLDEKMRAVRATILFSATLRPIDYFTDILGVKEADKLVLPSPFDRDCLFPAIMTEVSMRYADREYMLNEVIKIIKTVTSAKRGNYLVFLPSYEFLSRISQAYSKLYGYESLIIQKPNMSEREKSEFLSAFTEGKSLLGFAVLGGMFSESVDLAGDKLIGTIIVGTGLAGINTEDNIKSEYFMNTRESGFEYAYLYPAINKVLQAAGRVIRSENDRGICILVDDRYATPAYSKLLSSHLRDIRLINSCNGLKSELCKFWSKN